MKFYSSLFRIPLSSLEKNHILIKTHSCYIETISLFISTYQYQRIKVNRHPWQLMVKNPPTMKEMRVQSLGEEDPLEKEMATHSRILAWGIPWAEEPSELQSMGSHKSPTRLSD